MTISHLLSLVTRSSYIRQKPFWLLFVSSAVLRCAAPLPDMEAPRPVYCGPYQQARQVAGRTMCPHTRLQCPYGMHRCRSCGRSGHGAEDCWFVAPPAEASPPSPKAVVVPSIDCKVGGKEEKDDSGVPPPSILVSTSIPSAGCQPASSSDMPRVDRSQFQLLSDTDDSYYEGGGGVNVVKLEAASESREELWQNLVEMFCEET